jgi:hypothetical protein
MRIAGAIIGFVGLFALSDVPSLGVEQLCGAVSCGRYREMEEQQREEEQRRLDETREQFRRTLDKVRPALERVPRQSGELKRRMDAMQRQIDEMEKNPSPPPIIVNPILRQTERLD